MNITFRKFEIEVIQLLTKERLPEEVINKIISHKGTSEYQHTDGGYYLTISEDWIPSDRMVFSEPAVIGEYKDIQSGFLAFINDHEFMLECHDWSAVQTPDNFRDLDVNVSIIKPTKIDLTNKKVEPEA